MKNKILNWWVQFCRFEKEGTWDMTSFGMSQLDNYAVEKITHDIRTGVRILSVVFIILLSASAILNTALELGHDYLYTFLILAFLAAHVHFSASTVRNMKELYLLGMALLVISSSALVLQAHQTGTINLPVYLGVVLIFVVIPLVPWGLREALLTVSLIYLVVTLSTTTAGHRFGMNTLLLLQFFMLSTSLIVLLLVWRSAVLRKKEIRSLFELEEAHDEMRQLSLRDPLTGAWNRRYLQEKFDEVSTRHSRTGLPVYFLLFDLNRFKHLNDILGHDCGDKVLIWVVKLFSSRLKKDEVFVRMGGDEFALLTCRDSRNEVHAAARDLLKRQQRAGWSEAHVVTMCCGMTRFSPQRAQIPFNDVYKDADKLLYSAKEESRGCDESMQALTMHFNETQDARTQEGLDI